jgi:hypothetical protein
MSVEQNQQKQTQERLFDMQNLANGFRVGMLRSSANGGTGLLPDFLVR